MCSVILKHIIILSFVLFFKIFLSSYQLNTETLSSPKVNNRFCLISHQKRLSTFDSLVKVKQMGYVWISCPCVIATSPDRSSVTDNQTIPHHYFNISKISQETCHPFQQNNAIKSYRKHVQNSYCHLVVVKIFISPTISIFTDSMIWLFKQHYACSYQDYLHLSNFS